MNFFKNLNARIKRMFNFQEEKTGFEGKQIFCFKERKFITESDCLSSILEVTDRKELTVCREECEYGKELRASCPFDERWRKLQIENMEKLGGEKITSVSTPEPVKIETPVWVPEEKEETQNEFTFTGDIPDIPEPKNPIKSLGQCLIAARESLGLTQKQVANNKESNFSIRSYRRWEKDEVKISPEKRKSLSAILHLPDDFFD